MKKKLVLIGVVLGIVVGGLLMVNGAWVKHGVPLPRPEDVINSFANLINEGRISDAVGIIKTANDTEKQTWGVALNNFANFEIKNIKGGADVYEVDINVTLKEDLQDLPIPNYGWVNGVNKRWFTLVKDGNTYKITGIGTGP